MGSPVILKTCTYFELGHSLQNKPNYGNFILYYVELAIMKRIAQKKQAEAISIGAYRLYSG